MAENVNEKDIDNLISQVKEQARQRNRRAMPGLEVSAPWEKKEYSLHELFMFDGEEFVSNAYHCILKREPDPEGFGHYMSHLRRGLITRTFLLWIMRNSDEGRAREVRIWEFDLDDKKEYDLPEFLKYPDEPFILNSYKAIVGKAMHYEDYVKFFSILALLKTGQMSRRGLLWKLRHSAEGRRRGVKIKGLRGGFCHLVGMVPVIGYLARLIVAIVRLPMSGSDIERVEACMNARPGSQD
jgi:hypothetical protein